LLTFIVILVYLNLKRTYFSKNKSTNVNESNLLLSELDKISLFIKVCPIWWSYCDVTNYHKGMQIFQVDGSIFKTPNNNKIIYVPEQIQLK
jgi:hypothetical protein